MKKTAVIMLLIALFALSAPAFADEAYASADMRALAAAYLPETAIYVKCDLEDGCYELVYLLDETNEICEVTLSRDNAKVKRVEREAFDISGSANVTLSEQAARDILLKLYPDAVIEDVTLEKDDGLYEYALIFTNALFEGKLKLNPETGETLKTELWYLDELGVLIDAAPSNTVSSDKKAASSGSSASQAKIGTAKAKQIALDKAGSGRVTSIELDYEHGKAIYEGEVRTSTHEIDFEIDAYTGKVLQWDKERLDDDD